VSGLALSPLPLRLTSNELTNPPRVSFVWGAGGSAIRARNDEAQLTVLNNYQLVFHRRASTSLLFQYSKLSSVPVEHQLSMLKEQNRLRAPSNMSSNASSIRARCISTRVRHRAETHVESELHAVGFLLSRPAHSSGRPRRLAVHSGDSCLPHSRRIIGESSSRIYKEHPEGKGGRNNFTGWRVTACITLFGLHLCQSCDTKI
jgi:hypothetical protein